MKNNGFIDEIEEETELDKKYNDLVNYYKVFKCKNFLDQNFIELNKEKIGKFIKKLRLKNKMSQYDLANKIKISRQAISKWERGESAPSREILIKLSEIFKVSINEFLGGKKKKETEILSYYEKINILEERLKDLDHFIHYNISNIDNRIINLEEQLKDLENKSTFHVIMIIVILVILLIMLIYWR